VYLRRERQPRVTRFDVFMREWGVRTRVYARRAGISPSQLRRIRRGESEPTRRLMVALVETASAMLSRPVYMVELFELPRADEAIYAALMERKLS
jgi:transcriptional regulator with XRE-family HTH domain